MANFCKRFPFLKASAFIFGTALVSATLVNTAYAGNSTCTATVGKMTFPVLSGSSARGTSTQGSIKVSCTGSPLPAYITDSNGLPFCLMLIPNSTDAAYTGAGTRVMYLNGQPGVSPVINFQFLTNYRGCGGTDQGKNPPLTCLWGSSDANNYGSGYVDFAYRSKANGNWLTQAVITSDQALWVGSYSNNFILRLVWNDTQYPSGTPNTTAGGMYRPSELCRSTAPITGSRDYPLTVSSTVQNSCSVLTVPPLSFGSHMNLSDVKQQVGTIKVTCSGGVTFRLGVGKGNAASGLPWAGGWRGMQCTGGACGSSVIYYNLYKDSGQTDIWGDLGSSHDKQDVSSGSYQIYAGIAPNNVQQSLGLSLPPVPGTYKDNVIVTLQPAVVIVK